MRVAHLSAEFGDLGLDLGHRFAVGVAHHRYDEAAIGADGDADIVVILIDDVVAIDLGVDVGNFL